MIYGQGGFVRSTSTAVNSRFPDDDPNVGAPDLPLLQAPGPQASGPDIDIRVNSMDARSSAEYFRGDDFRASMRFVKATKDPR
jgi:hypothetical protein